jgi:hypothetical protein
MSNGDDAAPRKHPSRFWTLAGHALYLSAGLSYGAMAFRPESVTQAFGLLGGTIALIFGGGSWVNAKERDVWEAQVRTGQPVDMGGGGT